MKNVLFLCTGNSCRSQMAEGFALNLKSKKFQFYSAGTKKHGMNPRAVKVMAEVGIDISNHYSKTTDELSNLKMDFVITVCSDANENCPFYAGEFIIHQGFDDPPRLTSHLTNEEEILTVYRRVRDEIGIFVNTLENKLENK